MRSNLPRKWAGARWGALASLALAFAATGSSCAAEDDEFIAEDETVVDETPDLTPEDGADSEALVIAAAITPTFRVTLTPETGIAGTQRVNFAVPLPAARITDPNQIRISAGAAKAPWPPNALPSDASALASSKCHSSPCATRDIFKTSPGASGRTRQRHRDATNP